MFLWCPLALLWCQEMMLMVSVAISSYSVKLDPTTTTTYFLQDMTQTTIFDKGVVMLF